MPTHMSIPFPYVINRPYGQFVHPSFPYNHYQPAAPAYGQIPANNQQQRQQQAAQSAAPTAMTQPTSSGEFSFGHMEMYPPVIQAPVNQPVQQPAAPNQKTAPKKSASKALQIINPLTGKSIFDEDSSSATSSGNPSGSSINVSQTVSVEKTVSAAQVSDISKTEAVEEKTSITVMEPSTPVVSAMTDGPSVDITPKHQAHKVKKK